MTPGVLGAGCQWIFFALQNDLAEIQLGRAYFVAFHSTKMGFLQKKKEGDVLFLMNLPSSGVIEKPPCKRRVLRRKANSFS